MHNHDEKPGRSHTVWTSTSTATAYYATAACISSRAGTTLSDASKTQSASTT